MKTTILKAALLALIAVTGTAHALPVSGQGTWETTLLGRDINGNAVAGSDASAVFFYDTVLKVTWLRDANVNGLMNWQDAKEWSANLVVGAYDDWRLPTLTPVNGTTFNHNFTNNGASDYGTAATGVGWGTASEMGHLFYVTLGNKGYWTPGAGGSSGTDLTVQPGYGLKNTGDFQDLQANAYWSGLATSLPCCAWRFIPEFGFQDFGDGEAQSWLALAVRPGDVIAAVPEPETYALMLAGLALVGAAAKRKARRAQ
jgi:hypothetical protein